MITGYISRYSAKVRNITVVSRKGTTLHAADLNHNVKDMHRIAVMEHINHNFLNTQLISAPLTGRYVHILETPHGKY